MGGFLQSILFGYAGLRLTIEKLTVNPIMPPGITNFTLQGELNDRDVPDDIVIYSFLAFLSGLDYLGCSFDVNVVPSTVQVNVRGGDCSGLQISYNATITKLKSTGNERLAFLRGPFTIQRQTPLPCPTLEELANAKSNGPENTPALKFTLFAAFLSLMNVFHKFGL